MTADRTTLQNHGQDAKPSEETTRASLVEKVGLAACKMALSGKHCPCAFEGKFSCAEELPGRIATAAIALIRAETLEEAARVFDEMWGGITPDEVAAAIRALKGEEGMNCFVHLIGHKDSL